jgi:hypothetical protein
LIYHVRLLPIFEHEQLIPGWRVHITLKLWIGWTASANDVSKRKKPKKKEERVNHK